MKLAAVRRWVRPTGPGLVATQVAVALIAAAGALWLVVGWRSTAAEGPLSFRVDTTLTTSVEVLEPIEGRTQPRPVGALAEPDGRVAELVLDEVIVHIADPAQLTAFLARWGGEVLDSFPADAEGQDHLVRVDASRADLATLAGNLLAVEPGQSGAHRVSDERVLRLLALVAAEWRNGTEVIVDWLTDSTSIADGELYEASDIVQDGNRKNVFDWSFMRTGGALDIGVAEAWQLLETHGRLTSSVRYMVMDAGFSPNFDFPEKSKVRKDEWGNRNTRECSPTDPRHWHGTDVVLAAMGQVGNEYGTAGPAGPVVSQLIAVGKALDYWTEMRRLEDMAEEEHPDVVNLSFSRDVYVGSAHTKTWTDRRMRHVQETGALIVAAAGNAGKTVDGDRLWVPCESTYVMCVGGMGYDAALDASSNYGEGDSSTSVEIYGPMCVRSIKDPNRSALDFTTREVCGTSFSSPFVGGVAALVKAADPTLGPEEIRRIINETAHVGGLGEKVTGSQRRINALAAVARALGVEVGPPVVNIQAPTNGKEIGPEDWVDLRGTATDFMGRALTLRWTSDRDGVLADAAKTSVPALSQGVHLITANATDAAGRSTSARVTVEVVDTPPTVEIASPPLGIETPEGSIVALIGTSLDPDTWASVPDADTKWEVRRGGAVVHAATGHMATLPAAQAIPGSYTVKFTAAGVTVQREFTVVAIPPGEVKPTANITKPSQNLTLGAYNGAAQGIAFTGTGTNGQGVAVSGTRYRWVAYSSKQTRVLCEGSGVPTGATPGSIVAVKSCASFTAELGIATGDVQSTTWSVWLEVYGASVTPIALDSVQVKIQYVTG